MMQNVVILLIYSFTIGVVSYFLAKYIYQVYHRKNSRIEKIIAPIEKKLYQWFKISPEKEMTAKQYITTIIIFSMVGIAFLFLLLLLQNEIPSYVKENGKISWNLAFQTTISYVTNTNLLLLQEEQISEWVKMIGVTVQQYVSPAIAICVLFVLIRGFTQTKKETIGNFWEDIIRVILLILLPISFVTSILLMATGVPQQIGTRQEIITLEGDKKEYALGPIASYEAIKQLGSNGGGYVQENASSPFENPTVWSNWIEYTAILVLPISLLLFFGMEIKEKKQSLAIGITMSILFFIGLGMMTFSEYSAANMEGKENRFGIFSSTLWTQTITATSNGANNSQLESYAIGSKIVMLTNLALGGIVYGGVGSGLYTMIGFVLLTVFLAGLMIGKTPEYLKKKIGPKDMIAIMGITFSTPIIILVASSISSLFLPTGESDFTNWIYVFLSAGTNNGSILTTTTNHPIFSIILSFTMLLGRYIPIIATIWLAGNLAQKEKSIVTSTSLKTTSPVFVGMNLTVILLIGALNFLPILALGPIHQILG